MLFVLVLVPTM